MRSTIIEILKYQNESQNEQLTISSSQKKSSKKLVQFIFKILSLPKKKKKKYISQYEK